MSMNDKPAFPHVYESFTSDGGSSSYFCEIGLTKRELFAAMAMQGMVTDPGCNVSNHAEGFARSAVLIADALIAALEK
jgi:hypothetical protein